MLTKAAEHDRSVILEYCMAEPNVNLFILGDIENYGFGNSFQDVWFTTLEGNISGIALRYHDNLIVYTRNLDKPFSEVMEILKECNIRVISGKQSVMNQIFPLVSDKFTKREMVFCELLEPAKLLNDIEEVQAALPENAMEIAEVYGQISEFSGIYASDVDVRQKQIVNRIISREGIHFFIRRDGKIISHANSAGETSVSGMIGGVLTLPEFRHQSLASKVISAVSRDLARRGKSACLFYDKHLSSSIFNRLGFQVTNFWTILEKGTNE